MSSFFFHVVFLGSTERKYKDNIKMEVKEMDGIMLVGRVH
jgi:hypothetical protein